MKHSNSQIISACLKPNWRQICTHIPHTPPPYWLYAVIKQLWKSSISQISTWSAWEIGVHTALLVASAIASSVVFHYMLCKPYPKILIHVHNPYHIFLIFKSTLSLGQKWLLQFYLHLQTFSIWHTTLAADPVTLYNQLLFQPLVQHCLHNVALFCIIGTSTSVDSKAAITSLT